VPNPQPTLNDPLPARQQFDALVKENVSLCREHFRLVLSLNRFPATRPGQFIQVACRQFDLEEPADVEIEWHPGQRIEPVNRELLGPLAVLRRPFSLAGRRDTSTGVELNIIHRVVGIGTDWLSHLAPGDTVNILGPLGNRFELPPPDHTAILVGGGVGIPPMLYLAEYLKDRNAVAFCGATTKDLLPLSITDDSADALTPSMRIAEFARHGIPTVITTDDASYGFGGFVTQALERWLDANFGRPTTIYTCGPEPMMKRLADIAISRNIPCQVAVERAMACGMGTCQSCVIRVKANNKRGWAYQLACTDGPIFQAGELLW
jgi:dihydroorotate dehydrogenase electron transfer subunit